MKKLNENYKKKAGFVWKVLISLKSFGQGALSFVATNAVASAALVAVGATAVVGFAQVNTLTGKVETAQSQVQQLTQQASNELKPLIDQLRTDLDLKSSGLQTALDTKAIQLNLDIQTSAEEAQLELIEARDELINSLNATSRTLTSNILLLKDDQKTINALLASNIGLTNEQLATLIQTVSDNRTSSEQEIANLQSTTSTQSTQLAGVPPVGSISYIVDESLVDLNYYSKCEGTTIGSYTFPTNLAGYYVETGIPDGIAYDDSTAVNGLSVQGVGNHTHFSFGDSTSSLAAGESGADMVQSNDDGTQNLAQVESEPAGNHTHSLSSTDTYTVPRHLVAQCYVRVF